MDKSFGLTCLGGIRINNKYMALLEISPPVYADHRADHQSDRIDLLEQFREAIPFLQEIPDIICFKLDTSEFFLPDQAISQARRELENLLTCHVMTYNKEVFNLKIPVCEHLCANLESANLSRSQLEILNAYEHRFRRLSQVSFVAYAKPLKIIDPKESLIYKLYSERGLLGR